jgi:integrase
VLDLEGIMPNPARDRVHVRLPREDAADLEPPNADAVEAVAWRLPLSYLLALLVLEASGARVGEFEAAKIGDLDEERGAWLVRASVSKTRRARWVELPDDLLVELVARLPAREDRDPAAPLLAGWSSTRLRMAITRACRDAGVTHFSPHALRHRRISLEHRRGLSWAEIGDRMGQRSRLVTADIYSHALLDPRELDRARLLERVRAARAVPTPVPTPEEELARFAG